MSTLLDLAPKDGHKPEQTSSRHPTEQNIDGFKITL